MKRKMIKGIAMILLASMVALVATNVFAGGYGGLIDDINNKADNRENPASDSVKNFIASILQIAKIVGVGVAIIMLIVLAIKYISAAPGDKAEIKKHAVVYVVGAVVLFAASGILSIIQKFAEANVNG